MSFEAELAEGLTFLRERAEERMQDTCVVEFTNNERDENDDLIYVERFASKCRIKDQGFADGDSDTAGRREVTGATQVHLPWNAEQVFQDDRIRITAIGPLTPPRQLGKSWLVGSDQDTSNNTATRLNVKEAP